MNARVNAGVRRSAGSVSVGLVLLASLGALPAMGGCIASLPGSSTIGGPGATPSRPRSNAAVLSVSAAASLAEAFNEIGALFQGEHPGVQVQFNYAGSQQLVQQLAQGASADVFASASEEHMRLAVESGRVASGAEKTFARNRLAIIYPADNPAQLRSAQDLARPGLRLVMAAAEVPAGRYAREFLDKASADPAFGPGFGPGVLNNVVSYEENVKAVVSKVALGEADAGIAYASDAIGSSSGKIGLLQIPDQVNVTATYPIALVADSRQPGLAEEFIQLVLSTEGQEILARHGFASTN